MSAATTAASRRSGPGTSISWIPSARILADARLLPKLVMTFAGPWFVQQPPEGASNGECPILPIPYDGSNVWLNQPIICGTGGRHASHGHRNLHRRHARPCHQAEHEPPVRGERAVARFGLRMAVALRGLQDALRKL